VKLRFTKRASRQIEKALDYIAEKSPQGAARVGAQIQAVALLLSQHPYAGHATSRIGIRRINISPYPYLIFYRVTDDEVIIQRLYHTSRNPSRVPGPA
jgi:toxin ParE1/3/4